MSTANPAQLLLLADHIKLSLLERQRAVSLNLDPNSNDAQISRSLDSLASGVQAIETQLSQSEDASLRDQYERLKSQYADLSSQFHAPAPASRQQQQSTITTPNDPSLSSDFNAARSSKRPPPPANKSVRFTDDPSANPNLAADAGLFPYRDEPDDNGPPDQSHLSNQQIHEYHASVLREQDEQLDALGHSIGRQRDLSIQIGSELDEHALMLDEVDERVDRHQGQLDRARSRLGRIARGAKDNWSMTTIVVLVVILVLLIVITK